MAYSTRLAGPWARCAATAVALLLMDAASPVRAATPPRSPDEQKEDAALRAQAADLIKAAVMQCFNRPVPTRRARIAIRFSLNPDGTLKSAPEPLTRGQRRAAMNRAGLRAIKNCAPYALPESLRGAPALWSTQTIEFR